MLFAGDFLPIEKDSNDTYIQYFIEFDRRYTQDSYDDKENKTLKVASIQLRFTGKDAETWAKSMHHLTKRADIGEILWCVCGAEVLESVGEIRPALIDFFGKNGQIAFDVRIRLRYWETIELPWKQLQHGVPTADEPDAAGSPPRHRGNPRRPTSPPHGS